MILRNLFKNFMKKTQGPLVSKFMILLLLYTIKIAYWYIGLIVLIVHRQVAQGHSLIQNDQSSNHCFK